MKNNKIILILFLLFSIAPNLFSQQNSNSDSTIINGLYKGSWSMQFKINNSFTLGSFDGSNLAIKYHFTKRSALRFGITLNARNMDTDYDAVYDGNPNMTDEDNFNNRNDFYITFKPLYLFYPMTEKPVSLFLGVGPYFQYGQYKIQYNWNRNNTDTLVYISDENITNVRYGLGVSFVGGVEVFVTKYLSLHAEYGSNFYYSYNEEKKEKNGEDIISGKFNTKTKKTSDGYNFSANSVMFGVSLYF